MLIKAGTEVVTELAIKPGIKAGWYWSCNRIAYKAGSEVVTEMHIKAGTEVVTEMHIKACNWSCNRNSLLRLLLKL